MALREVTRQRAYKGQCRSCKAPEMVLCKDDCKYEDPWAEYYLGPREKDRLRARALKARDEAAEASGDLTRISFTGPGNLTYTGNSTAQTASQETR